ncbi:MAG: hypothetical protein K8S16_14735 [Bacteroidales bacterium]|nr:hypothetical protein [Bacteroidales bacterium]
MTGKYIYIIIGLLLVTFIPIFFNLEKIEFAPDIYASEWLKTFFVSIILYVILIGFNKEQSIKRSNRLDQQNIGIYISNIDNIIQYLSIEEIDNNNSRFNTLWCVFRSNSDETNIRSIFKNQQLVIKIIESHKLDNLENDFLIQKITLEKYSEINSNEKLKIIQFLSKLKKIILQQP